MSLGTHEAAYVTERARRWELGAKQERPVVERFAEILRARFRISEDALQVKRFDELIFGEFPPEESEWAKGSPDFMISIAVGGELRYVYPEVKTKAQEFRKTLTGGLTASGQHIAKYECTSYYLDEVPVYENMVNFAQATGIDEDSFILIFADPELEDLRYVSLRHLREMVEMGWELADGSVVPLCKYGDGYGATTWLIPKEATRSVWDMTLDNLKLILSRHLVDGATVSIPSDLALGG